MKTPDVHEQGHATSNTAFTDSIVPIVTKNRYLWSYVKIHGLVQARRTELRSGMAVKMACVPF